MKKIFMVILVCVFRLASIGFASHVLAQTPIEGWDKVKFGMSRKELRDVYSEEEKYFEDTQRFGGDFWSEEHADRDEVTPYELVTSQLEVLTSKSWVHFKFVRVIEDGFGKDKLFEISISGGVVVSDGMKVLGITDSELGKLVEEAEKLQMGLEKLEDVLIDKYGKPVREEKWERRKTLIWKDREGNSLRLTIYHERFKGYDFPYFWVTYSDSELTGLWEKKAAKWREERKKGKEKDVGSF